MTYRRMVLATGNQGKLAEFRQGMELFDIEVVPQSNFTDQEADETGLTFVENAIIKARHACQASGLPALADDSGLEVDALFGQPGIYSSRYASDSTSAQALNVSRDAANNAKLLNTLADTPAHERSARFQCVLVFMRHAEDPVPLICQGSWEGTILTQAYGGGGFGYDPLFGVANPDGQEGTESTQASNLISAAQLNKAQKMALSHRGKALSILLQKLASQWR